MADMDVVIIGGGVGGYVAAIKGVQLGLKVTLVEKDKIGGICLNHGCIPTKSLASSAQIWEYLKNASQYGLSAENISFDFYKIIQRKDKIVNRLTMGVQSLLKVRKVNVLEGTADLISPTEVKVNLNNDKQEIIKTKNVIIATGSAVRKINVAGIDNNRDIIDTNEALTLQGLPKKMLIIGAGYSGVEFASIFNSFGVEVYVLDLLKRILLPVDEEIANSLFNILKKQGINFLLNSKLEKVVSKKDGLSVNIKSIDKAEKEEVSVEKLLISTGRVPDFGGLNIQGLGIELENEGIKVDKYMRTNIPGIYAVGDVVAKKMLAHVATAQGQVAVQHIAGIDRSMSYRVVPFCVFTNPEVASVGYNENEAREKFTDINIFRFPYRANGKALGMDEKEGYVKMIANAKDNQVVGIHIIGAHASDLIAEATLAIQQRCTASDIAETIHAHPTLPETIAETAEGILGQPIHVLK
ncbi:MAG: dihydrolipoyl dehydrogenase [Atribacterota bacterium]